MIRFLSHNSNNYFVIFSGLFLAGLITAIFSFYYWVVIIPFVVLFFYLGWQQWQFIFFLLIFSLSWSTEYSFSASLGTDLPDEPLMVLTAALFIAYWFYKPSEISQTWKHPLINLLFLHLCWIFFSIFFSTDWLVSLKFFLAKSWYAAAFVFTPLIIFRNNRAIRIVALIFLFSILVLIILAMYRHYQLGLTFAKINDAVQPFFRNHVNYSAMVVCALPILMAVFQLHKKSRLLIILAGIIVSCALFLSYSRGAWLALLIGAASYWLIQKKILFISFIAAIIFTTASLFWISKNDRYLQFAHDYKTTIFHKNFQEHLIATYRLKDVSTAERFNRWIAGVRMINNKWATGYGPNTFYINYKPYAIPVFRTWVSANKDRSTVHNYFLLTVIEQGLPGLFIFLLLVGSMLYYSQYLYKRIKDKFYKTTVMTCGVMLMMIIVVNFLSDLIETDKIGSLFFLCLATLVAADINTRNEELQSASHI